VIKKVCVEFLAEQPASVFDDDAWKELKREKSDFATSMLEEAVKIAKESRGIARRSRSSTMSG